MTSTPVVVIGAGGHGREVLDIFRACSSMLDLEFVGFLDDGALDPVLLSRLDANHLGGLEKLAGLAGTVHYVGIGDPATRRRVAERALERGSTPGPPLVHPRAHVGTDVHLAEGTILAPGAVVTTNVRVGRHGYVGANVVIGHDSSLADFVSVYPGATISGNCQIGTGTTIGTNAAMRQGIRVGSQATVGAGAVVVRDVAPSTVVAGVPARPL